MIDGATGLFFRDQTADSLAAALQAAQTLSFSPECLQTHARRFDSAVFADRMHRFVEAAWTDHRRNAFPPDLRNEDRPLRNDNDLPSRTSALSFRFAK